MLIVGFNFSALWFYLSLCASISEFEFVSNAEINRSAIAKILLYTVHIFLGVNFAYTLILHLAFHFFSILIYMYKYN